ncbi:MAG: hypothetical protein ABIO57_03000 [Candidatus Paceibacterota bacterium]
MTNLATMNHNNSIIPCTAAMLVKKDGYIVMINKHIDSLTCNKICFKVDNDFIFQEELPVDTYYQLRTGRVHNSPALPQTSFFTPEQRELALLYSEEYGDQTVYTIDLQEEKKFKNLHQQPVLPEEIIPTVEVLCSTQKPLHKKAFKKPAKRTVCLSQLSMLIKKH